MDNFFKIGRITNFSMADYQISLIFQYLLDFLELCYLQVHNFKMFAHPGPVLNLRVLLFKEVTVWAKIV